MNAQFVFQTPATDSVAASIGIHLPDKERANSLDSWRGIGEASKHQVDNVVGEVMLSKRNPDFCMLGESFGLKSFKVDNAMDLEKITNEFLSYKGPALCEYVVEPEICLPLVGPGKALDDMIMFDDYHKENQKINFDKNAVPS